MSKYVLLDAECSDADSDEHEEETETEDDRAFIDDKEIEVDYSPLPVDLLFEDDASLKDAPLNDAPLKEVPIKKASPVGASSVLASYSGSGRSRMAGAGVVNGSDHGTYEAKVEANAKATPCMAQSPRRSRCLYEQPEPLFQPLFQPQSLNASKTVEPTTSIATSIKSNGRKRGRSRLSKI